MNDYRHVCFKDLEGYFKKSDYLGGLSESEKKNIRNNLEVPSLEEVSSKLGGVVEGTYEEIKELVDTNQLNSFCVYVITDFQTIYKSNTNEVWGLNVEPSKIYQLVLNPISKHQFSKEIEIVENGVVKDWIVRYDFTQKIIDGVKTKGEIIFLQDENNNSAYYDFKNIKFEMHLTNSDVPALKNSGNYKLFTFSKYQNEQFIENSLEAYNNQFDQNCYENVFLGTTNNNSFFGGFKRNLFIANCINNKFSWDTFGNKFTGNVMYTEGTLQNALVTTTIYDSAVSKEFKMLYDQIGAKPIFVITYLDASTLTPQVNVINLTKL